MNIEELARSFPPSPRGNNAEWWDERNLHWERMRDQNISLRALDDQRILRMTDFLLSHKLLAADTTVLDLGCGPGRYACSMARHCANVTGIDISPHAIQIARAEAAAQGIKNASFKVMAYHDVSKLACSYNLLFAMFSAAFFDLDFLLASRSFCHGAGCLCVYTHRYDEIKDSISKKLFGRPAEQYRDTEAFSALFSILLRLGYEPQVSYIKEQYTEERILNSGYAADLAQVLSPADGISIEQEVYQILRARSKDNIVRGKVSGTLAQLWWSYR